LAILAGVASATADIDSIFMNYVATFGKKYQTHQEYRERLYIFKHRYHQIQKRIDENANFQLGLNKFSDRTKAEITSIMGYKGDDKKITYIEPQVIGKAPDSVDWNTSGCVTPIKDQGHCGSCWTFCSAASAESAWCIARGDLLTLSTQQFVDCVDSDLGYTDDAGCSGGWTYDVYDWLTEHRAMSEEAYPYTSYNGDDSTDCLWDSSNTTLMHLASWKYVQRNVADMKWSVSQRPMAVSIQADQDIFHAYTSGVIDSTDCGYATNHAVVVNGYGVDSATGLEYWLVRNSWGTDWGEAGYAKIAITDSPVDEDGNLLGICGIGRRPLTALV